MALITVVNTVELTVDFEELAGFPKLTDGPDKQPTLTTEYKVAWPDAPTLLLQLRGNEQGDVTRVRDLPHAHPIRPNMFFKTGVLGPLDENIALATNPTGDVRFASYTHAKITCTYAVPPFAPGDTGTPADTFFSEGFNPRAEFLTIPVTLLFWDAGKTEALAEADAPQKIIRLADWTFVDNWRATFPDAAFDLMGAVNDANVKAPRIGRTFGEGELLFQPPRAATVLNGDGVQGWKLEYNLTYKPTGWNNFYHNGSFSRIYDNAGAELDVYDPGDFKDIIP